MNLEFRINEDYALAKILLEQWRLEYPCVKQYEPYKEDIKNLIEKAREISQEGCENLEKLSKAHFDEKIYKNRINGEFVYILPTTKIEDIKSHYNPDQISILIDKLGLTDEKAFEKFLNPIIELFSELKEKSEYTKIKSQIEDFKNRIGEDWTKNYPKSKEYMEKITRLEFNDDYVVLVTHPSLGECRRLDDNYVSFGGTLGFKHHMKRDPLKNYPSIYIWHEIMHKFVSVPGYVNEAVIEIATDNALRVKLNGGRYLPLEGHNSEDDPDCSPEYDKVRREIYEKHWKGYLKSKKNIIQFRDEMLAKYNSRFE